MYKQFFGLRENPFNANPDPRYLFLNPQAREALEEMTYGIQARKGLIVLTGEVGTGKTTLINCLLESLRAQQTPTAFIFNSHLAINHLFELVLADFGVPSRAESKGNALMRLNQWLIERYRAGDTPVLIVDEAQGLPIDLLEEIRLLLNLENPHEKLLQIVLAGQPELEERLQQPDMRQFKQRITVRCKTAALTAEETRDYIGARLRIAGANGKPVFASQAVDAVHFYSRGIPRVVNLLCEHALINSFVEHVQPVPARIIEEVARDFCFDDIKPLEPWFDSADSLSSYAVPAQMALESAPFQSSPSSELFLRQKQTDASMNKISGPFIVADVAPGPANEHAAAVPDCEEGFVLTADKEFMNAFSASAPALAAFVPGIEAHRNAGSTAAAFDTAAAYHLLTKLAVERTPPASSPLIRVVAAKGGPNRWLASSRHQASAPAKRAHTAVKNIAKLIPLKSAQIGFVAIQVVLVRWSEKCRDGFLTAATSPAWRLMSATLIRWLRKPLHSIRALYFRWPVLGRAWHSMSESVEWPRRRAVVLQWLNQPFNPMQWIVPNSRWFEARRGASYRKM
jgi:general secretion pathway protein A